MEGYTSDAHSATQTERSIEDKDACGHRLREGWEFFSTPRQRKQDLRTAVAAVPALA
jgi:hypothetical protein